MKFTSLLFFVLILAICGCGQEKAEKGPISRDSLSAEAENVKTLDFDVETPSIDTLKEITAFRDIRFGISKRKLFSVLNGDPKVYLGKYDEPNQYYSDYKIKIGSYDYSFNLTSSGSEYLIPSLQDGSPMILVLTGIDGVDYWSEYVAYPQVPLELGVTMDSDYVLSDVSTCTYLVEVSGNHYKIEIQFRSPEEYD